ncbi:MAG: DUF5985 family protein [Verrucomicrobiota bacterium]|jgi:hypothetical protein
MAETVYILCAATSFVCAVLLLKRYKQTGLRLLQWSGACFIWLAMANVLLFVDLVMLPDINLLFVRTLTTLIGLMFLLYGLIWENR